MSMQRMVKSCCVLSFRSCGVRIRSGTEKGAHEREVRERCKNVTVWQLSNNRRGENGHFYHGGFHSLDLKRCFFKRIPYGMGIAKRLRGDHMTMLKFQKTIGQEIQFTGIGLHTGRTATMKLKPAPVNTGVVFRRTDLGGAEIHAIAGNTAATSYATTLSAAGVTVKTVEHLLSALAGLGIHNVYVEIDTEEVPILDGSAAPLVRSLADAGIHTQELVQPVLKIVKPVFVREGNKQIALWPADTSSISYFIDFNHPMLREQSLHVHLTEEDFLRNVADARTFGFMSEVEALRANGLAQGGSMDNAVVLGDDSVLNKEGLRYKDEFVRHKILDLIGDLSLAGMPIIGHIVAHKSGHSLNAKMVSKLLNSPQHWIILGSHDETQERTQDAFYQHQAML